MKKMLVAAAAALIAFTASNANAQCIGCQQNAQPVFSATQPVQSFAPVQSYSAPIQSYSAPMQSYSAPMQSIPAPVQSYSAPMQSYSAPMQSFAPAQNYSSPCNCGTVASTPMYSTPIQSYPTSGCIGCANGMVSQPIFNGTVTSGTVISSGTVVDSGTVEGSIVEPSESTPTAAGEASSESTMEEGKSMIEEGKAMIEKSMEPPVPPVSSPGPEADGT